MDEQRRPYHHSPPLLPHRQWRLQHTHSSRCHAKVNGLCLTPHPKGARLQHRCEIGFGHKDIQKRMARSLPLPSIYVIWYHPLAVFSSAHTFEHSFLLEFRDYKLHAICRNVSKRIRHPSNNSCSGINIIHFLSDRRCNNQPPISIYGPLNIPFCCQLPYLLINRRSVIKAGVSSGDAYSNLSPYLVMTLLGRVLYIPACMV